MIFTHAIDCEIHMCSTGEPRVQRAVDGEQADITAHVGECKYARIGRIE